MVLSYAHGREQAGTEGKWAMSQTSLFLTTVHSPQSMRILCAAMGRQGKAEPQDGQSLGL